jgi:hypothetical protein
MAGAAAERVPPRHDRHAGSGVPRVDVRRQHHGIRQLAVAGDAIYARDASSFFRVDTKSNTETAVGRTPVELVSANAYYDAHRWTKEDREAGILFLSLPVIVFLLLCVTFVRAVVRDGAAPALRRM